MKHKIKNIEQAAKRIREAVTNKEKIILYGDSDCDGISSIVILGEAIKSLGGYITAVAFPDRELDGYGMNFKALDVLQKYAPALFITADLGIANVKEVDAANTMGFEVLIIDHHQVLDALPKANIIVDPQQKDDDSGYGYLCNTGLIFKLIEEMLGDSFSEIQRNSLLELTALATISDMVPQIDDNKIFIEEGLRSLKNTFRPGLKALLDVLGPGEAAAQGYLRLISCINAAESIDFNNQAYELLTSSDSQTCRDIAETLLAKVILKQKNIKDIVQEVERRIAKKPDETIVFQGDPAWKLTLAGPVASIIASKYEKPTFIYRKMDEESAGSVRSLKDGQNSVEAMKSCADILITYGGHPKASGFRIKNENLEKFKERLMQHFNKP